MSREFLYGRRPVMEALRAKRRNITRVIFANPPEESPPLAEIAQLARKTGTRIETQRRQLLDELTGSANHQGVIADAGAYPYVALEDIMAAANQKGEPPLILLLDLIQDVQNVGTLIRTAEAVG